LPAGPRDTVSITITGVPSDATLSAGTNNGGGSWTLTPAQLSGLTLKAGEVTTASLTVTATNTQGVTASSSKNISLTVNPVAPGLTAPTSLSVNEDGTVALGISETPFDARDTVSITVTGVPSDATLSTGTKNSNGSWTLTPAQLSGLTLKAGEETTTNLTVTATNTEGVTASSSKSISLTVSPVAEPPSAAAPVTLTLNESATNVAVTGVSVGPSAEDSDDSVSATLTVGHGALHVGALAGVLESGVDSGTLTLSGNAATVNSALAGLTIRRRRNTRAPTRWASR
jgi:VCBS repeat-containing protein